MGIRLIKAAERLSKSLDIPEDVVINIPKITIVGNNEISIENHQGVRYFQQDVIKINSKIGEIILEGDKINIIYMSKTTIVLNGNFTGISYK
ncbi:MAG: sporulation protein YqfC [Clostridiaceae bacterium]